MLGRAENHVGRRFHALDGFQYVTALLDRFAPRLDGALDFAITHRVLLVRSSNGKDIDIALGALPFEKEMVSRALPISLAPGLSLPCCTAEDLLIMKLFAGRPRDGDDATGVLARQRGRLDLGYVLHHVEALLVLKDVPEQLERARRLLGEAT